MTEINQSMLVQAFGSTYDDWEQRRARELQVIRVAMLDDAGGPDLVIDIDRLPQSDSEEPLLPPVFVRPGVDNNVISKALQFAEDFRDNLDDLLDD
jgi:hypothetical protein